MEERQFSYGDSTINYLQFGVGPRVVLCFHGYGEKADSYSFFEKYVSNDFTFISIDLPFHGKTTWLPGKDFHLKDLTGIINNILAENNLSKTGLSFTVIGFSLGGRVALCLYQSMPQQIEKIILLAPDGLKINFWYWLSTQTWAGNKLFLFTMKHPAWFFRVLKLVNLLGLVNVSVFKFVNYYIGDKEFRRLLYLRWTSLRKLKPGIKQIKRLIPIHKTEVKLVYGKFDRIILPARGIKFKKGIEDFTSLTVIHSGHQVLHEKHVNEILPLLNSDQDNA